MAAQAAPKPRPHQQRTDPLDLLVLALFLTLAWLCLFPILLPAVLTGALIVFVPRAQRPLTVLAACGLAAGAALAWRSGTFTQDAALAAGWWYAGVQRNAAVGLAEVVLAHQPLVAFPWRDYLTTLLPVVLVGLLLGIPLGFAANAATRGTHGATSLHQAPIADAGVLAQQPPKVMAWLVPNVVGRGAISLISAPPGGGKGWWLWALARAAQGGETFFGQRVSRQRILWCTEEGQSFERTARQFGIKPGLVYCLRREDVGAYDPRTEWGSVVQRVRKMAWEKRCGLVVFDTVRAWCPQAEKAPEDAYAVMDVARRELTKPGLGALFVHHDTKAGGLFGAGVSGTYGLVGAVDVLIELKRVSDDPADPRRRMVTSRRFEPLDLTATLEDWRYVVPQGDAGVLALPVTDVADTSIPEHVRATVAMLPIHEGITAEQLSTALALTKQAVQARLSVAYDLGLVMREGAGTKTAPYLWRQAAAPAGWDGSTYPPGFDDDAYRKTPHWAYVRQTALERSQGSCEDCQQAKAVDAHHLTYTSLWHETPQDCRALCLACHRHRHATPAA